MGATEWVAVYAAIVSTGALFLEIRRWFESGPKLKLSVMPEALMTGEGDKLFTIVTASNRGNAPTTVTAFELVEFPS